MQLVGILECRAQEHSPVTPGGQEYLEDPPPPPYMHSKTHEGQAGSASSQWRAPHGKRLCCQVSLRKPALSNIKLIWNETFLQLAKPQNPLF